MSTFTPYPAGIARMLASREMVRAMKRRAERGKTYAESISPIDTGRYVRSFHVTSGVRDGVAYALLYNDASTGQPTPKDGEASAAFNTRVKRWRSRRRRKGITDEGTCYAVFLEFGTRHMAAQRILGRAMDAMQ